MNKNNQQETHIDTSWFATAKYIFLVFIYATAVCMFRWGWGCNNNLYHQVIVLAHLYLTNLKNQRNPKAAYGNGNYIVALILGKSLHYRH